MLADTAPTPMWSLPAVRDPGPAQRLLARVRRNALDRALAEDADPSTSTLLAARAMQLGRPGTRRRLAEALEHLTLSAEDPPGLFAPLISRPAVRANRRRLFDLAERLRGPEPLYASGIAALRMTIVDGSGPAYRDRCGEALARHLERAARKLAA